MNPLTAPTLTFDAELSESLKRALAFGISTALEQRCGLILYAGSMEDWRCAYPPAGLSVHGAAEWARRNGITLRPGDSYWTAAEVAAANWSGLN